MRQAGGFHNTRPAAGPAGPGSGSVSAPTAPSTIPTHHAAPRPPRALFGDALRGTILVCDRYSAYKKLVRDLGGLVTIQFCWSHVRRDFIRVAVRNNDLLDWRDQWLDRFATLFRLHRECLDQYDPERQSAAFSKVHRRLKREVDRLFTEAERQNADLAQTDRRQKALRSLLKHRRGFVRVPRAPANAAP